jgi:biopolymer transport protein ExbB
MKKVSMTRSFNFLTGKAAGLLAAGLLAALLMTPVAARAEPAAPAAKDAAASLDGPAADHPSSEANAAAIPTKNLLRIMQQGGLVMWPLAFCSLVMMTFLFERLVSLRRSRVLPRPFTRRFLEQIREGHLDREQALTLCEENHSAVAQAFAGAVRAWGRPTVEVEQAFLDAGERATNGLRRYLRVFHAISTIGPLLGLLGTVVGIIEAFNAVASANALGHAELLAGGISKALLTTAFGLIVAIPSLTLYHLFVGRVDQFIMEIDRLGQELIHLISADGLQNRSQELRISKVRRAAKTESA